MTDATLVRAPVGVVYRTLTDLDAWPRWLGGCRSERLPPVGSTDRHRLVLRATAVRRVRLVVEVDGWRHDAGVQWRIVRRGSAGQVTAEWWLEGRPEGAVIHLVLQDVPRTRRERRRQDRLRRALNLAMQEMKDHLELAVAVAAGRVP